MIQDYNKIKTKLEGVCLPDLSDFSYNLEISIALTKIFCILFSFIIYNITLLFKLFSFFFPFSISLLWLLPRHPSTLRYYSLLSFGERVVRYDIYFSKQFREIKRVFRLLSFSLSLFPLWRTEDFGLRKAENLHINSIKSYAV